MKENEKNKLKIWAKSANPFKSYEFSKFMITALMGIHAVGEWKIYAVLIWACDTKGKKSTFSWLFWKNKKKCSLVYRMNGELYNHDVTDSFNSADRTDAHERSDHELWKFITLERIGRFCSNFHSLFFWFFFIHWWKENPRGWFPFKLAKYCSMSIRISSARRDRTEAGQLVPVSPMLESKLQRPTIWRRCKCDENKGKGSDPPSFWFRSWLRLQGR